MAEIRTVWRGKRLDQRTVAMLIEAEKLAKVPFVLSQGSYNTGVAASAGTHDGGGAVDISVHALNSTQRAAVVLALRQVGFAAWLRTPEQGNWPYHIHGIAAGDQDLSRGAAFQVAEYARKRNGLANRGADTGPAGYYGMTWDLYLKNKAAKSGQQPMGSTKPDITISLGALDYARRNDGMSGVWGNDRAQVLAWAAHPKVAAITLAERLPPAGRAWHLHFQEMTKKIQRKFGLVVDGRFGPKTAEVMKRYGYRIIA
jgi:hypothetical protein